MSTFIQKLRTITLGAAHDLLDKAIDLNSPSALRQYVRDLEDALDKLKNEAAVQAGTIRTLTREQGDLKIRITAGTAAAQSYSVGGRTDLARAKASDVLRSKAMLEANEKALLAQQATSTNIDAAVTKLETRHMEMVSRVRDLERLDRETKAKEQGANALTAAGKLVSGGADISVDDIESKMQARNDIATEKFNRAMGDVRTDDDPEHEAAIDDFLSGITPPKTTTTAAC